jgi:hypothetical protein
LPAASRLGGGNTRDNAEITLQDGANGIVTFEDHLLEATTPIYLRSVSPQRNLNQPLTTADVARILKITPDGVLYLERRGKLRAQHTPSGQRIFQLDDVERLRLARARGVRGELEPPDAA